ncbi:MAG: T9SS type A sorting domain-containing protein, partial [Ignavibacteriaceae bacterium]|nr:T9SS type A sorting domain-containing protein [Ignavibacteriaceae bacterium]
SFTLYQNYPNPFNPATTIKFALPVDSRVKINIYNSLGQLVETLVDKEMESGYHEINFDASRLASGVYLYQLQAGEYVSVKKMLMLK